MKSQLPHHVGTLSPEMALLGQLFNGPGYGYELHQKVVTDLGEVWHLSQSQAYSILKRLEIRGDILAQEQPQDRLPSRLVLSMTSQGRERFLAWLDTTSSGSTRAIRLEFVTRVYFLRQYFPKKIAGAFDRQREEAHKCIRGLKMRLANLPDDQVFNRMSLEMRLQQLSTVLEWLDRFQKQFHPE